MEEIDLRDKILNLLAFRNHWSEICLTLLEYHEEMQKKFGSAQRGRPSNEGNQEGWGVRQTAEDLRISIAMVSDYLNLGRLLRDDPNLKYRELRDAICILRIRRKKK